MAVNNMSSIKTNFSKSFSLPAGEGDSPAGEEKMGQFKKIYKVCTRHFKKTLFVLTMQVNKHFAEICFNTAVVNSHD